MKPISPRPIFTLSLFTAANQKIIKKSRFLAFSTQTHHQSPFFRRHEEESRSVRVSVWWDFENCNLPVNTNVFTVGQCITNAVRANGIKGPIQITAFGDVMQISRSNQEALSSSGINLTHVPAGGKNSADISLLVDLMFWVSQNPPPAHVFLISGDRDFANILHRLRRNNYNILLASPDSAPSVLCSSATIMWQWSSLLKGENLTGKLFNQPPDGPYNSWYGHYKAPLEDPFAITEFPVDELSASSEFATDAKLRPIPKAVMNHIAKILGSSPNGIPITILRAELDKSHLVIDKDFYGYKKFSRFLLAMPHLLKLQYVSDGQYIVRGVNGKFLDESSNGESEIRFSECVSEKEKSFVAPVQEPKVKACGANLQDLSKEEKRKEPKRNGVEKSEKVKLKEPSKRVEVASPIVENKKISEEKNKNELLIPDEHQSDSGFGILKRIWMKLFGSGDTNEEKSSGNDGVDQKSAKFVSPALFSPSSHEAMMYDKNARRDDEAANLSGGFNRALSWFKFWSSSEFDDKEEKNGEILHQEKVSPIFSSESFWNEMESFIDTSEGQAAFLQARTREQLVQNLQKHGPPVLRPLSQSDLLHLINLLISDKKWVEVLNSQPFPFQLTRPVPKDPHTNTPNGLHHIFSNLHGPGEKKHQNPPHAGVTQPVSSLRSSSGKPRSEILVDCQKLIDHIIKEHPEGFNIRSFRKLFIEKNGYPLDLQKLGYEKLVNLLHIMPGARVESNLIFPADRFKSLDVRNSDSEREKSDESDSTWDELGPIDKPKPNKEMDPTKARMGKNGPKVLVYEPLEINDSSDSEEEGIRSEKDAKSSLKNEEESSLMQILDSWYSSKGGNNGETTDGSPGFGLGPETKNEYLGPISPIKKQKHVKSYSFVTEAQKVESGDRIVDGILGSLKKSAEPKVPS